MQGDDRYNLQLYSQLLELMGFDFPKKVPEGAWVDDKYRQEVTTGEERLSFIRVVDCIFYRRQEVVFGGLKGIDSSDKLKLLFKSNFKVFPAQLKCSYSGFKPSPPNFDKKRLGFRDLQSADEFGDSF